MQQFKCSNCGDKAYIRCNDCDKYYCHQCSNLFHGRRINRQHDFFLIGNKPVVGAASGGAAGGAPVHSKSKETLLEKRQSLERQLKDLTLQADKAKDVSDETREIVKFYIESEEEQQSLINELFNEKDKYEAPVQYECVNTILAAKKARDAINRERQLLWGGFPGYDNTEKYVRLAKSSIKQAKLELDAGDLDKSEKEIEAAKDAINRVFKMAEDVKKIEERSKLQIDKLIADVQNKLAIADNAIRNEIHKKEVAAYEKELADKAAYEKELAVYEKSKLESLLELGEAGPPRSWLALSLRVGTREALKAIADGDPVRAKTIRENLEAQLQEQIEREKLYKEKEGSKTKKRGSKKKYKRNSRKQKY